MSRLSLRAALAAVLMAAALTGCIRSTVKTEGDQPNDVLIGGVREGETTQDQLVGLLGQPTYRRPLDGEGQMLVYQYQWRETTETTMPLVYHKGGQTTHIVLLECQVKDGIVVSCRRRELPVAGP